MHVSPRTVAAAPCSTVWCMCSCIADSSLVQVILLQHLPSDLFADPYQLQDTMRFRGEASEYLLIPAATSSVGCSCCLHGPVQHAAVHQLNRAAPQACATQNMYVNEPSIMAVSKADHLLHLQLVC